MRKYLIITADDFGLHEGVNEAVESAARDGVLTAASLMVGAPAAADAVRRAAQLPTLRVGLHLVLADGDPVLDQTLIPSLVGDDGRMGPRMAYDGLRYFLFPSLHKQLEAEIRAQFAAFERTRLRLDHVNVHKHFHLHPTVLSLLLRVAREYGSPPVRATMEPLKFAFHRGWAAGMAATALRPCALLCRQRLRNASVPHNDSLFGISASGAMDEGTLLQILANLPRGVTEIYLHPATQSGAAVSPSMAGYRHQEEWSALLSPRIRAAISASGAIQGGFQDFLEANSAPVSNRRPIEASPEHGGGAHDYHADNSACHKKPATLDMQRTRSNDVP
jgi:hopanoid biosynthesis associated protein HpnK